MSKFKEIQEQTCILTDPVTFFQKAVQNINKNPSSLRFRREFLICLLFIEEKISSLEEKDEIDKAYALKLEIGKLLGDLTDDADNKFYQPTVKKLLIDYYKKKEKKRCALTLGEIGELIEKHLNRGNDPKKEKLEASFPPPGKIFKILNFAKAK